MAETFGVPPELEPMFRRAQEYVAHYFRAQRADPVQGSISIFGERYLLIRAASMSVEFFATIRHLYRDKSDVEARHVAYSLLFDFAHAIGAADARNFHQRMELRDPLERLSAGPVHFAHTGWARVELHPDSVLVADESFLLIYDHPNSFEADAWLAAKQHVESPVCIMNAGYSSGWCEESFGLPLVSVEILCRAMGDERCRFVMAPPAQIEAQLARYLRTHPEVARTPAHYEIPGFFRRKQVEDELREREAQYRSIFEAASDAMLLVDTAGQIVAANPAAHRLYGYQAGALVGRPGREITPPGSRALWEQVVASVTTLGHYSGEAVGVARDRGVFDIELRASAFRYHKRQHLLVVVRDISERRRIEAERLRRQEEEARRHERMRDDLALARTVQSSFLPHAPPWSQEQLAVCARSQPAHEVGGDFYAYVALGAGRYAVVLGDISGKGVAAALVVALVVSTIEEQAHQTGQPGAFLGALNQRLVEQLQACHMFAALLYLVVDLHERALYVANAGLVAPLLVRGGEARLLDVRGLPLGILRDVSYDEVRVALQPGDRLVLVSDGVVEARSRLGELWGFERLQQLLAAATSANTPEALAEQVLGRVEAFADGVPLHDDLTLLVLEPKSICRAV